MSSTAEHSKAAGLDVRQALREVREAARLRPSDEPRWRVSDEGRRAVGALLGAYVAASARGRGITLGARQVLELLLMPLPLIALPSRVGGVFELAMLPAADGPVAPSAQIWIRVYRGRPVDQASSALEGGVAAVAQGTLAQWLRAMLCGRTDAIGLIDDRPRRTLGEITQLVEALQRELRPQAGRELLRRDARLRREPLAALGVLHCVGESGDASAAELARARSLDPGEAEARLRWLTELGLLASLAADGG